MRREFARKKLISCPFSRLRGAAKPRIGEIPCIFPASREFGISDRGSQDDATKPADHLRAASVVISQEGVRWHDGKPFTSRDVKWTWDLLTGKANERLRINPRRSWYSNLEEVVTDGDYDVRFVLKRPRNEIGHQEYETEHGPSYFMFRRRPSPPTLVVPSGNPGIPPAGVSILAERALSVEVAYLRQRGAARRR
jgi:hypothetical protein